MSSPDLPELLALEQCMAQALTCSSVPVQIWSADAAGPAPFPVHALALGAGDAPAALGFFGGVHGLERIGTQVVLAWLRTLLSRLPWDLTLQQQLRQVRLVFMPLVNPGGMWRGTRANPSGVDLMRNAPVDADEPVPPLVGGHRLGAGLPWFRGRIDAPMEPESTALCDVVRRELHGRAFSLALDCHSGFGLQDRLWLPFAHSRRPPPVLPELFALVRTFEATHPHHPYVIEPQSRQYLAHGDLWDHLLLQAPSSGGPFLALTLEMGSWLWVKKNPRQLFTRHGLFNPLRLHRHRRVLRRHDVLPEFLLRAAAAAPRWLPAVHEREALARAARQRWAGQGAAA